MAGNNPSAIDNYLGYFILILFIGFAARTAIDILTGMMYFCCKKEKSETSEEPPLEDNPSPKPRNNPDSIPPPISDQIPSLITTPINQTPSPPPPSALPKPQEHKSSSKPKPATKRQTHLRSTIN